MQPIEKIRTCEIIKLMEAEVAVNVAIWKQKIHGFKSFSNKQ